MELVPAESNWNVTILNSVHIQVDTGTSFLRVIETEEVNKNE